ncbi:cupin domain-containing protein [Rhodobacteraceae bacterium 2CG4]|uniref:Cupin domain-containing protein n=1 Tax=Halovulum marinum TaxID=2662447 RepID=A0A6L5YXN4_9RHOB|nr:cupin domain-containing protein [Halovulum marinum]MSU89093.1 cupin domain-containing protein [Halovulum marinum]
MIIYPCGSRPTQTGPESTFTGSVRLDPIASAPDAPGVRANLVSFAPGARTHWHSHTHGQVLHLTQGAGLIALRGEAPRPIRAGDSIWIPPDVEHWHGAAPDTAMTHVAMQPSPQGDETDWLEPVEDGDYTRPPAG